jgi:type IV pilus assembly protein PilA
MISNRGFSLIELMIVVVIVGILAALAIPRYVMVSHQAKVREAETILRHVFQAQETWKTFENGTTTDDLADLEAVGYAAPTHMEFYEIPDPVGGYALPFCLVSKSPDAWPSRQVNEDGTFVNC